MWRIAPFIVAGVIFGVAPITGSDIPARVVEYVQPKAPEKEVMLVAVGDIMLSRAVAGKMRLHGADYPFASTTDFLKGADIAFGNLEGPITPGPEILPYEMRFRADATAATALAEAGFDILSLANNHMLDFGEAGILDTMRALDAEGVAHAGAGRNVDEAMQPAYMTAEGIRFAFLAFSYAGWAGAESAGTAPMRAERMAEAVREAKQFADFVIVSMHAGDEYEPYPNAQQIAFAHAAIDAGAEMLIGHHPHVIQPVEVYKGKYIFYSLGNFVFDQMWSEETREGLALRATFTKKGLSGVTYHPVRIEDYARPFLMEGKDAVRLIEQTTRPLPVDSANTAF